MAANSPKKPLVQTTQDQTPPARRPAAPSTPREIQRSPSLPQPVFRTPGVTLPRPSIVAGSSVGAPPAAAVRRPATLAGGDCGGGRRWAALVGTRSEWRCGGALIGHRLLLTAARCVAGRSSSSLVVRLGEDDAFSDADNAEVTDVGVVRSAIHPLHDGGRHDLAVVLLSDGPPANASVCLPTAAARLRRDQPLLAFGWGVSPFGGGFPPAQLTVTTMAEMRNVDCDAAYRVLPTYRREFPRGVTRTELCVRPSEEAAGGLCPQDRGGALVDRDTRRRYRLMGLMREAVGCGSIVFPNLYTRVTEYADWVRSVASELSRE